MMALLLWAFTPLALQASLQAAAPNQVENVPYKVCEQSFFWTRPSEDVQAKIWNDPRYQGYANKSHDWTHYFFKISDSASIAYQLANTTGIWTADDVQRNCGRGDYEQLGAGPRIEIWTVLHKVESIRRQDAVYTLVVKPTEKGFQIVDFARPSGPMRNLTFIFVNPEGQELDCITEQGMDLEGFSGRVIEVEPGKVRIDTKEGKKELTVSSNSSIWKGGAVDLSAVEPGDNLFGSGVPQPDGTIAAGNIVVNRTSFPGFVESFTAGKIQVVPASFNGIRRGPAIAVDIGPNTKLDGVRLEDIRRGLYLIIVGVERRDGSVQAASITTLTNQPSPESAAKALDSSR